MAGLGLGAVSGTLRWLESREPFVDTSRRADASAPSPEPAQNGDHLRFAVATMVSAEATFSMYRLLVQRICRDVGRREAFVLAPSYGDVRRQLEKGKVDVAFVCTGTYVHSLAGKRVKLLVQPEFKEGQDYRSLLIVPARSAARKWEDLRGAVMACSDPESNTGCIVPKAALADRGHTLETFFRKVVITGSHDHSIQAVALGAVDAACVDSLVFDSNLHQDPSLRPRIKVIWRSPAFGPPPIVVPVDLDEGLQRSLKQAFLALPDDPEGREILSGIGILRFVPARPEDYRTAALLFNRVKSPGRTP